MNAIRTMAVLGFCVVLAGCAGSHHQVQSTADPGTITLEEARKGIEEGYTWATQRERWRRTPDGWKLAMVDGVRDMTRLVDGKPE